MFYREVFGMSIFERVFDKIGDDEKAAEAVQAAAPEQVASLAPEHLARVSERCLAAAALSVYCAACDGNVSIEEYMEMDINIGKIKGKVKLPETVEKELDKISSHHDITWEEVVVYLDKLNLDSLMELSDDVADIVVASDGVNEDEQRVVDQFANYVKSRV